MDNYKKGKQVKESLDRDKIPIPDLAKDFVWMQVAEGSKMRNLLKHATKSMKDGKQVVWTAFGPSIGKAISCAEILKRKFQAYQITKICYTKVNDCWDPYISDLETLVVRREIPTMHILLSREPLNAGEIGYQEPGKLFPGKLVPGLKLDENSDSEETQKKLRKSEKRKKRSHFLKQMTSNNEDVHTYN